MDRDRNDAHPHALWRRPSVLVGRAREQVFLREELAAAHGGHGRLILIGGEAGIGKTSLAQDLAAEAASHGSLVLTGHCFDLTNTPPYGPWLDLLGEYAADADLPAPPDAFAGGRVDRVRDQVALFADVRRFFTELASSRPLLLLLEDLHWADPASLELFRHIAPRVSRLPILLVGTYRVDELTRRHPFYQQLPALAREADGIRLDLKRLDRDALHSLVAARYTLIADDEARLTAYLLRHAEGNPFFATELLRAVEEERLLAPVNGGWALKALDRVMVPTFLRQVIDGRVERLGEDVRQALAVAAIIGQEVPLRLWGEIARLDEEQLLAIVEKAVEAHLLVAERDGAHVRFVHALTRESLYEGVLPTRRRLWHLQVAEALMTGERPDPDAVAYHLQHAGDGRAWDWLVKATDRAQRAYALLTAAERLRAAADLLGDTPEQDHHRARLLHRLGRLLRFSDPAAALTALDEAKRLALRLGDSVLAAEILYVSGVVLSYLERFREGLAAKTAAVEALEAMPLETMRIASPTDPWLADSLPEAAPLDLAAEREAVARLHAAGLHCRRASQPMFLASAGQTELAVSIANQYVTTLAGVSGAVGGVRSMCGFSYAGLGIAYAALGQPDDAGHAFARSREFFAEYAHHALVTFTLLFELHDVAMAYRAADPAYRRRLAAEAEAAMARAGGAFHPEVSPRLAWLGCLVIDGRWPEAIAILRDLPDPHNAFLRRAVTAAAALLAWRQGDPDSAWAQIHARFPAGAATAPGDHIHQEGLFLQRLAADLALDTDDLMAAHAWLTAHDAWLAWSGSLLGRAEGLLSWARFHLLSGEPTQARVLAAEALSCSPALPLVQLAAHRLLGEIAAVTGEEAPADMHLATSLALADACEAPFERALTLLALTELRIARGDLDDAAAGLEEARQTCASLGAAPALARADALAARLAGTVYEAAHPAGLTRREIDVLRLLARRQTDKEIADALYLAPRTVQTHVGHILAKLDVANRREAAVAAERLGLL